MGTRIFGSGVCPAQGLFKPRSHHTALAQLGHVGNDLVTPRRVKAWFSTLGSERDPGRRLAECRGR